MASSSFPSSNGGGSGSAPARNGVVRFRTSLRNTVLDVMRSRGWRETDHDTDWDFHWADVGWIREVMDHVRLEEHQRVNHFRNHYELTRKDLTIKNLKRMKRALEKEEKLDEAAKYDFSPATYCLPQDFGLFEVDYKKNPNSIWIMKPPAKAQGKGIFLFTKISQVAEWRNNHRRLQGGAEGSSSAAQSAANAATPNQPEPYLAQRYVDNPHLVGGKKYDLRIYALVTSFAPLTVWLHRTGFARFCHHRYSLKDVENTFIHVTNVAVQKTNPKYTAQSGCKYGIRSLKQYFASTIGADAANKLFGDIQDLILKTLHAVQKIMMNDKHAFEMYGYDILIDETMRPWLMEVNSSPSLTAETPADYHLKFNLLEDMFNIIDMERRLKGNEERVGGFDLIWRNGPVGPLVQPEQSHIVRTYLGCRNDYEIPVSKIKKPPKMEGSASSERSLT